MQAAAQVPEPVVFSIAVEALYFRALDKRLPPDLILSLRKIGIDLEKPLLPGYPFRLWLNALAKTGEVLFPNLPKDRAFHELGKLLVTSYQETLIGKAMFAALRLLSPRRVIDRMARNFRTSNNFTEVKIHTVHKTCVDLEFNLVEDEPSFTAGILASGLPLAGLKEVSVGVRFFDGSSATFRVQWAE